MAAFNDRLALAPEHYIAVGAVPYPKLFCAADYCEEMAVPHKNAWLAWPNENATKLAIVYVHTCIAV